MQNILHERYQEGSSPIHRLDPRVKVIVALCLITGISLTPPPHWIAYPMLWVLIGFIVELSGLNVWRVARQAGIALPFALAAVTLLFTTPGEPLIEFGGLTISEAGMLRFLGVLAKSWLAVQVALILAMTTPFTDLLWALGRLRVPATLIAIFSFMYRYLFTLTDEAGRLMRAREARSAAIPGQRAGGSIIWRARVAGGMIGNLFLRSYERSERVYAAMLARGYSGQMRTLDPPPLTRQAVGQGIIPVLVLILIQILASLP
ncbi:MAG: cobalt ECF transporter T component CbiQ [Chloroflexi bacterium]|nr:cobalt ECF transporter T component CbiQ [Chloroflexota bacterium]